MPDTSQAPPLPHETQPHETLLLAPLVERLLRHEDLTADEASQVMHAVMAGRTSPAALAGFLVALAMKGERPAEIVGFARTMRAHAVTLSAPMPDVFDTCGTGGDRSGSFNISSAAAVVVAACGVMVAKHGNRSVSSRCGSADVFEALGVNVAAAPAVVERALREVGIAFFFAPTFHPAMRHVAQTRRDLGVRTAFNLLGPLTNPAGASRQIVGVPRSELTELMARALVMLGSDRAWVVHGADGLDEISTTGYTKVSECRHRTVKTFFVHPSDFGVRRAAVADLVGGDVKENAEIIRRVLGGESGPHRDIVVLNAAVALYLSGRAVSVVEGLTTAAAAIDAGTASRTLDRMARASHADAGTSKDGVSQERAVHGGLAEDGAVE
jgi:anthranilate phosphoribosyltransferase